MYMMADIFTASSQMATHPFEDWGLPGPGKTAADVDEESVSFVHVYQILDNCIVLTLDVAVSFRRNFARWAHL